MSENVQTMLCEAINRSTPEQPDVSPVGKHWHRTIRSEAYYYCTASHMLISSYASQ